MFKRANKVTSLLIAAAAVVSLVPANAADVKKIDSEDGTIYNAVAYADGKAYVDGDVNDSEAAYVVDKGEFTSLEDVDSGDDAVLYGEKYLNVSDGDYTLDLEAGTVTDDNIVSDTEDDAASALRKKIKDDTDDRYESNKANLGNTQETKEVGTGLYDLKEVPGAKYGKIWYATKYANVSSDSHCGAQLNVFTDTEGNYIDADYNLGKIKVSTTGDSVNIDNTDDDYDLGSGTVTASIAQTAVIAQDADYIYRKATLTLTSTVAMTGIGGVDFSATTTRLATAPTTSLTINVIQKISKEASTKDVSGANYAKNVTTYVVSKDDGSVLDGASDVLAAGNVRYTVAGGKLIAYSTDDTNKNVTVRAYTLKSSSGYYFMDEESKSKEDTEISNKVEEDAFDKCAVQTDKDGNLYRLDGGYIYKFDNTDDWDKIYKVDGSFDELAVYDEDNMIAWSESDEVYSLIGSTKTDAETPVETPVTTTGWVQATDGTWTYVKADGTKATGWLNLNGVWYYLKADGVMATGWVQDAGTWYFLQGSGAMATGWLNDNGTWYYLAGSGAMLANTTVDGYVLGASGAWVK